MKTINVLMTGAGAPGAAGIIKCLTQSTNINLIVADADESAVGKYLHNNFIQIPKATDADFIDEVLKVCNKKHIDIILPLVTKELFPLSENKELFVHNNIKVLVSSFKAIEIANNKSKCYQFLSGNNIVVPQFFVVNTVEEFKEAIVNLGYPYALVCFKPSISNGSRGFRIIDDNVDEADLLFNYKPNNTYITYNNALKILSSKSFPQLLISEYLPGDEFSVDCLAYNGECILALPRIRQKMVNGISVQGEFVKDEKIMDYCKKIIKTIGLHGNIGLQVKRRENGEALLLEINPRVQGTIVAALGAGVNLPLLAVKQEMNMAIDPSEIDVKWGTRFSRYWAEVYY